MKAEMENAARKMCQSAAAGSVAELCDYLAKLCETLNLELPSAAVADATGNVSDKLRVSQCVVPT